MTGQEIPAALVQLLSRDPDRATAGILRRLRKGGAIMPTGAIRVTDVRPADRGVFLAAVTRAEAVSRPKPTASSSRDQVWSYLQRSLRTCEKNARTRMIQFDLDRQAMWAMYVQSEGRCQVTGIAFSLERFGSSRAPFSPSIDRINSSLGYVSGNVRLTCQIANLAMNIWGDRVLLEFISRASKRSHFLR